MQIAERKINSKKIALGILGGACIAGILYYFSGQYGPTITPYNEARDKASIIKLFKDNWHWLISSDDYSPEFMLKHKAPNKNPFYFGKLNIHVLREQEAFAGFTAYYMKNKDFGFLLFVGVDSAFRGKGYGEKLVRFALNGLKDILCTIKV